MKCSMCGNDIVPDGITAGYGKDSSDNIFSQLCYCKRTKIELKDICSL